MGEISTYKVGESGKCGRKWKRICNFASMNNLIKHSILLMLAFSITLGSVGVAFGQQLCNMVMIGSTDAHEKEMSGCCSESESSGEYNDCCTLKVAYKKLDLISTAKADLAQKIFLIAPVLYLPDLQWTLGLVSSKTILTYSDSSPPLTGREILLLKNVLLV